MTRTLLAAALVLGLPLSVVACLWDRDTPAQEALGLEEVIAAITGRFERNPATFYELRLERVAAHLREHPDDLAAYDDAGVACDRLGRGNEAIAWMEAKRAQLERLAENDPFAQHHRYRFHANRGTFLVHRWVRAGADRGKLDDVKAARDEIARALEINPNAHFGREHYQLRAIEWLLDPPPAAGRSNLPNLLGWEPAGFQSTVDPQTADEAVRGLAGLVVLGNAWESVDVFHALSVALTHDTVGPEGRRFGDGRNILAYLAWLRCRELVNAGRGSLLPDAPRGAALLPMLAEPKSVMAGKALESTFESLRDEADAWQAQRTRYLSERLARGQHPDNDPDFWAGFNPPPPPALPEATPADRVRSAIERRSFLALGALAGLGALAAATVTTLVVRRRARVGRTSSQPQVAPRVTSTP